MSTPSPHEALFTPDRSAIDAFIRDTPGEELAAAIEPFAAEMLKMLRVDARIAFEAALRIEAVAEAADDPEARARARWLQAHALAGVSRVREAITAYRQAAEEYRALGKPETVSRIAIGEVNALNYVGRYDDAIAIGEVAHEELSQAGEDAAAARLDLNLGNIYQRIERPVDALARYDRALKTAERLGDQTIRRMTQINRGTILSALGRLEEAREIFEVVRAEAAREGEVRIQAIIDFNLGYVLFQRGEYGKAYDTLDAARIAFAELDEGMYLTATLVDLAELLIEVNNFGRAEELAAQARELANRHTLRFEAGRAALLQGIATLGLGDREIAWQHFDEAVQIFREEGNEGSLAFCETYLGELASERDDFAGAARLLERSAQTFARLKMRLHECAAWLRLANVDLTQGHVSHARERLRRSDALLRRVSSPWLRAKRSHLKGRLAASEGRLGWSIRHYRRAIEEIESIRNGIGIDEFRVSFAQDKAPIYSDLVEAVLRRDDGNSIAEAFETVERSRSRALVDLLAGRLDPATTRADPKARALLLRLNELGTELDRIGGQHRARPSERRVVPASGASVSVIRKRESEVRDLVRRLQRRHAELGALATGETTSLAAMQRTLPAGTSLVEYFLGEERSWAFVVRRGEARTVPLNIGTGELGRRLAQLRFQIEKASFPASKGRSVSSAGLQRHLSDLAAAIWVPLELEDSRVVIVPHGSLHSLPFAALPLGGGGAVVDHHLVTNLPSASSWRYVRSTQGAVGTLPADQLNVLAVEVGDSAIPEVHREVQEVRRAFGHGRTLRGGNATREALAHAATDADVIHIATHGLFRGDDPEFSALRLSDGWMSLYEVYGLPLRAQLVCLSACQTGRQWVGPGDELVGLSRGFLYAGASSLLMSLWAVADGSTADLMTQFYKAAGGGQPLDEALQTAMQAARELHEHPYHWASFALTGGAGLRLGARANAENDGVSWRAA